MIKIISAKWSKVAVAFVTTLCFSFNSFAVSSQIVNSFYNYAHYGQTSQMRQLMKMGYGIDVEDEDGVTAWCIAKDKDDEQALRVLRWMGADPKQKCTNGSAWPVAGAVIGALAVGGGVAALAGGGGGGGSDPCSGKPNSHQENGECICNDGYLEQEGVCYQDLNCSSFAGSTGHQLENKCECKAGYTGVTCESCADGYLNLNGLCYADLSCSEHSGSTGEQNANQCVCKTGYSGITCDSCSDGYTMFDGVCYANINCGAHGTQNKDRCVCEQGYFGDTCNSCADGYVRDSDGNCYVALNCGDHGRQQANQCVCDLGYSGDTCNSCADGYVFGSDGTTCYRKLTCEAPGSTGTQVNDHCECNEHYTGSTCTTCEAGYVKGTDGKTCYQQLDCGPNGTQQNDQCVCKTGYVGDSCDACDTASGYVDQGGVCVLDLKCSEHTPGATGVQEGNQCVCNEGYTGTTCEDCARGYSRNITGDSTCYKNLDCGAGTQVGNECQCPTGYLLGSGPKYCSTCDTASGYGKNGSGACVMKTDDVKSGTGNVNWNSGNINLDIGVTEHIDEYADLYGLKYDADAESTTTVPDKTSLYNSYSAPSSGTFTQSNAITLVQKSDGNVYGLYSDNAVSIYNMYVKSDSIVKANIAAEISITQDGNGDAYGIWGTGNLYNAWLSGGDTPTNDLTLASYVNIENKGKGSSYGMWSERGDVDNNGAYNSSISVANTSNAGGMITAGMRSGGGRISNSGDIIVTATSGKAYGIISEGDTGVVDNSGNLTVTGSSNTDLVVGIYAKGGTVTNTETGVIDVSGATGKTFGIIATNGATVNNEGTIKVNDVACTDCTTEQNAPYIVLDETSTLSNSRRLVSARSLNFDSFGGTVMLARGGTFEADGEISGNLTVDAAGISSNSFDDRYVAANAFNADEINVNLHSNSAMFTAEQEGNDVVLNRVAFNELSADSDVALFLERNYNDGNGSVLFNALRRSPSSDRYGNTESTWLGYGLLPNFSRENMRFMQNLNSVLNDKLFDTAENSTVRKMVGYDYFTQDRDNRGTLTGYDNYANSAYFMYDREVNTDWRAGFGMSVTHFYSSYDDDSTRKEIMVQGLLPLFYDAGNGVKAASIFRAGYGNGEYKRHTDNRTFESDLSEWIYGVSNSARYEIDLNLVKIEPVAEFNILGYYQNRIREDKDKIGAINADAENNLSVEAGLGLRLSKDFELNEHNKISFKAGAMYYHEFANPYHSLTASQYGMDGTYRITDYEGIYDRNRGVINAGVDYNWNEFTLYGNFNQYIEDESPFSVNLGIKYNFQSDETPESFEAFGSLFLDLRLAGLDMFGGVLQANSFFPYYLKLYCFLYAAVGGANIINIIHVHIFEAFD